MRSGLRRILLGIAAGILVLIILEVGIYNWRLALAMRCKALGDTLRELEWRRDELLVDRAALLCPGRLEAIGDSLGLAPLELTRFAVVDLSPAVDGGESYVCME